MRQYEGLVTRHVTDDHKGRPYGGEDGGRLGMGDDRFFTPLRYVQNDMWVGAALWSECQLGGEGGDFGDRIGMVSW